MLGKKNKRRTERKEGEEAQQRSKICVQILEDVGPLLRKWGITLHNFQLESTRIAHEGYANEYEKASLAMAKAKADCRTVAQTAIQSKIAAEAEAEKKRIASESGANSFRIEALAQAEATKIKAEAEAKATIIEAQAKAEAHRLESESKAKSIRLEAEAMADSKRLEGKARGDAADAMTNKFSQELALREQQVEAVRAMKVDTLNMLTHQQTGSWVDQLLPMVVASNTTSKQIFEERKEK